LNRSNALSSAVESLAFQPHACFNAAGAQSPSTLRIYRQKQPLISQVVSGIQHPSTIAEWLRRSSSRSSIRRARLPTERFSYWLDQSTVFVGLKATNFSVDPNVRTLSFRAAPHSIRKLKSIATARDTSAQTTFVSLRPC